MISTDEHLEWATVDRMRKMLEEGHDTYEATLNYALFTTILCWVMQRIRSRGQSKVEQKAQALHNSLKNQRISDPPWSLRTDDYNIENERKGPRRFGLFSDFRGFDAARFLEALRHATAHGDARNIKPNHYRRTLGGYELRYCEKNRDGVVTWRGTIILEWADMRRIGVAVADRFCGALSPALNSRDRGYFEAEARGLHEAPA